MQEELIRALAWTDYRLAVLFTVIVPVALTVWALVKKAEAIQRLLIIYWRVGSLLMITVYLLIPGWQIGYISGWFARVLIPISLWFWVDINEEIADQPPSQLKLLTTSWRWAATVYCVIGVIFTAPTLGCAISQEQLASSFCQVWREPPLGYRQIFHPGSTLGFLGFLGACGLCIYIIYLAYFVLIRLGKQGRSALEH